MSRRLARIGWARLCALTLGVCAVFGCTRSYYHDYADNDVYRILKSRLIDWRWRLPERPVEADPRSRMADRTDPNHTPIIPDEAAARRYQVSSRFPFEYIGWRKRGTAPIEDLNWQGAVSLEPDGKLLLGRDSIMRLGMLNSRDYQFQYENLYLSALNLTLARFQFMVQGYSSSALTYLPLTGAGYIPPVTSGEVTAGVTGASTSALTSTATGAASSGSTAGSTGGSSSTSTSGSSATASATSGSSAGSTAGAQTAARTAGRTFASNATSTTPNLNNQLQALTTNGFSLNLMTGAQLLVNMANQLVFQYSNHGMQIASPNLTINFIQPLLRGAWARIVTQSLSLQEREVLYTMRSFAEFRRQFYVGLITGSGGTSTSGYLGLVSQLQAIRNAQANLNSYRQNLDMYEAEMQAGLRTVLERDQLALNYQTTQAALLQQQAALQTALDAFKISLGLPPEMDVRIDDSVLDPFLLADERLNLLRFENDDLLIRLVQSKEPPRQELRDIATELSTAYALLEAVHDELREEIHRWRARLDRELKDGLKEPDLEHKKEIFAREDRLSQEILATIQDTDASIDSDQDALETFLARLETTPIAEAVPQLRDLMTKRFRDRLSNVYVAQTQTRVFLIELKPVDLTVDQAIQVALGNRLDLQNALAQVTDAWRQVEVDANSLRGFLNFVYTGSFNSAPNHATLFRFDASSTVQSFGLQFDAPINRRVERNQYRADQITYQRARRAYMLARDTVVQEIRLDTRQLALARRTFEINREQIISASRQLEQAEFALRTSTDTTAPVTLNLLNALSGVLSARNSLIQSWVNYETARFSLYRDFDLMDIDSNGVWTNEDDPTAIQIALRNANRAPAYSLGVPAQFPDLSPGRSSNSIFYIDTEPGGRAGGVPDRLDETEGPLGPRGDVERVPPPPVPAPAAAPSPFAPGRPGP